MIVPLESFGMPEEVYKAIALYVGGTAFIGLLLLVRRLIRSDVRRPSFLDDWFALAILLAIAGLGNVQTLVLHPPLHRDCVSVVVKHPLGEPYGRCWENSRGRRDR